MGLFKLYYKDLKLLLNKKQNYLITIYISIFIYDLK